MAHMTTIEIGFRVDGLLVVRTLHERRGSVIKDMEAYDAMNKVAEKYGIQVKYRPMYDTKWGYVIEDHKRFFKAVKALGYTQPFEGSPEWHLRCADTHAVAAEFEKLAAKLAKK